MEQKIVSKKRLLFSGVLEGQSYHSECLDPTVLNRVSNI